MGLSHLEYILHLLHPTTNQYNLKEKNLLGFFVLNIQQQHFCFVKQMPLMLY